MDRIPPRSRRLSLLLLTSWILVLPTAGVAGWSSEGFPISDVSTSVEPHVLAYGTDGIALTMVKGILDPVTSEPERSMVMVLTDVDGTFRGGFPLVGRTHPKPPLLVKYAAFGEDDLAVALLTDIGPFYALHVALVDPRHGWLWPEGAVAIDLGLRENPDYRTPLPEFDLARTESGRIVVTAVRDSTTHVDVLDRQGNLEFSYETEGTSFGASLAPRQGEEMWLLELNQVNQVRAHRFPVESGVRGEPILIARNVRDQDGEDRIGRISPDGEGGLWYAQASPFGEAGSSSSNLRVNHLSREGEVRWGQYGTRVFTSPAPFTRSTVAMDIRSFGPDRAYVTFTGWASAINDYSYENPHHVVIELGGGPEEIGIASRFLPAVAGVLPRLRLQPDGDLTVIWQSTTTSLRNARIEGGHPTEARYLGIPLEADPSVPRILIDLSHGGGLRDLLLWSNKIGESAYLRVLPEALIPGIRQPQEGTTWFQDQPATIRWRSAGLGLLDVDLSLDGGSSWVAIASGIEDTCDSLTFSVPELETLDARVRVSRRDTDMAEMSPVFSIHPRGPEFGSPLGQLRLSFTPDGSERVATIETLSPRDVYVLARVDFGNLGRSDWNDSIGLKAWESRVVIPEQLVVVERELLGPQPINVSPLQDHWAVGFGTSAPVGPRWVPLLRYGVMVVDPTVGDLRMDLRGPEPSSFDGYGGPGPIPGWLESPATGECPDACLRAFAGEVRASSVVLNPRSRDVALVEMDESPVGEQQRDFLMRLRLKTALAPEAPPWRDLHLTLETPTLVNDVVDLSVTGDATVEWDYGSRMLSLAVHRDAPTADTLDLELTMRAGSEIGEALFRVLSAQAYDADGRLIEPLVSLRELKVVERVPVLVSTFRLERSAPRPVLQWEAAAKGIEFRLWAHTADDRRSIEFHGQPSGAYRAEDSWFVAGKTLEYILEGRMGSAEPWVEIASVAAPTASSSPLALTVHPNPAREGTTLHWRGPVSQEAELRILDLRGRLVREWPVQLIAGQSHFLRWDGTDRNGREVAKGVYFAQLRTAERKLRQKITLLR